jgi:signal transduction histidine kinase/CheY-like chemotaxis protein
MRSETQGMWSACLRWIQRAPFAVQTLLVALVFATPVVVLAISAGHDYYEERDFTAGEIDGVHLLQTFGPLNSALLVARSTARVKAGRFKTQDTFPDSPVNVDNLFAATQLALKNSAIRTPQELDAALLALQSQWRSAAQSTSGLSADGQRTLFGPVTESSMALQQDIGDASGIILDPRIDTLYLGLTAIQVLPSLLENLEQIWSWSTYLSAKGDNITFAELNQARQRYAVWDVQVQAQIKTYRDYIKKVVDYHPSVKTQLNLDFLYQVERFRAMAFEVAMENAESDPKSLWLEGGQAFYRVFGAYEAVLPVLGELLQARLRSLEVKHLTLALATSVLLFLAAFAFNSFYRSIVRNMAQQQRTETDLRHDKQRAEDVAAVKSQFLANMSHEIRTPMNAILGMLKLLHGTELTLRQLDYVSKSEGAAKSLLGLINDILDFSKIDAGKLELDAAPFKLDKLLRDLSVILSVSAGSKPIEVLFDVDPKAPPWLVGDVLRLQQILINLCSNAIKFTSQGEVVIQIEVQGTTDEEAVLRFSVHDSGIGIAPDKQQYIFSGFSQAEASTTRRFGGTGLGLSISKRLVALMGGDLTLYSALGSGSTFQFTLSLAVARPLVNDTEHPARPNLGALDVLVVDDNELARNLLTAMAESLGWRVDAAADGAQAVAMVQSGDAAGRSPYHAIFMDWEMPGMDGWDTIARIRQSGSGTVVPITVMVTSHSREALSQRSMQEQVQLNAFLVKPITAAMMLDAVADARAGHSRMRSQTRAQKCEAVERLQGMHLLVVEDNPINQQVAQELLVAEGARVEVADNGLLGVAAVAEAKTPFHAVLMDIQMPVMDGYAATHAIRTELKLSDLPVIAMTANAMASDRQACLDAGMNDHVGKPFDLTHLVSVLLRHTGFEPLVLETTVARTPSGCTEVKEILSPALVEHVQAKKTLIDTQSALQRLSGMKPLYVRVMREFCADLQATVPEYRRLIAASLVVDAVRLMHTLKGTAATVGATELSDFAKALEARCKDPAKAVLKNSQADELELIVDATREALHQAIAQLDETTTMPASPGN